MRFQRILRTATASVVLWFGASSASATTIVFSDDFQDGDLAGWTLSSNYGGTSGIENTLLGGGASGSSTLGAGDRSLRAFMVPPPGIPLSNTTFTRAVTNFSAFAAGTYTLDLEARSRNCSGCTIFYEILLDGSALIDHTSPSAGNVQAFEAKQFTLAGLSAGTHTLSLGVYTTNASSGEFQAFFDDVVISTDIPEPATVAIFGLGLAGIGFSRRKKQSKT
jgi:hypothetical protein